MAIAQSKLIGSGDMLAGVMPILHLTFGLIAGTLVISLVAALAHYRSALQSTGDLRYARRCRRNTFQITSMICLVLSGLALYVFLT